MGLGYPGGPLIEKLAKGGNKHKIRFACSGAPELDFSFSGIKTAVLYYLKNKKPAVGAGFFMLCLISDCIMMPYIGI